MAGSEAEYRISVEIRFRLLPTPSFEVVPATFSNAEHKDTPLIGVLTSPNVALSPTSLAVMRWALQIPNFVQDVVKTVSAGSTPITVSTAGQLSSTEVSSTLVTPDDSSQPRLFTPSIPAANPHAHQASRTARPVVDQSKRDRSRSYNERDHSKQTNLKRPHDNSNENKSKRTRLGSSPTHHSISRNIITPVPTSDSTSFVIVIKKLPTEPKARPKLIDFLELASVDVLSMRWDKDQGSKVKPYAFLQLKNTPNAFDQLQAHLHRSPFFGMHLEIAYPSSPVDLKRTESSELDRIARHLESETISIEYSAFQQTSRFQSPDVIKSSPRQHDTPLEPSKPIESEPQVQSNLAIPCQAQTAASAQVLQEFPVLARITPASVSNAASINTGEQAQAASQATVAPRSKAPSPSVTDASVSNLQRPCEKPEPDRTAMTSLLDSRIRHIPAFVENNVVHFRLKNLPTYSGRKNHIPDIFKFAGRVVDFRLDSTTNTQTWGEGSLFMEYHSQLIPKVFAANGFVYYDRPIQISLAGATAPPPPKAVVYLCSNIPPTGMRVYQLRGLFQSAEKCPAILHIDWHFECTVQPWICYAYISFIFEPGLDELISRLNGVEFYGNCLRFDRIPNSIEHFKDGLALSRVLEIIRSPWPPNHYPLSTTNQQQASSSSYSSAVHIPSPASHSSSSHLPSQQSSAPSSSTAVPLKQTLPCNLSKEAILQELAKLPPEPGAIGINLVNSPLTSMINSVQQEILQHQLHQHESELKLPLAVEQFDQASASSMEEGEMRSPNVQILSKPAENNGTMVPSDPSPALPKLPLPQLAFPKLPAASAQAELEIHRQRVLLSLLKKSTMSSKNNAAIKTPDQS